MPYELTQTPEGGFHFDPVTETAVEQVVETPVAPAETAAPAAPVVEQPAVAPASVGQDLAPPVPAGAELEPDPTGQSEPPSPAESTGSSAAATEPETAGL